MKDKKEIEIDVFVRFETPEEFAISMEVLGCPIGVEALNLFAVLSLVFTPLSGDEGPSTKSFEFEKQMSSSNFSCETPRKLLVGIFVNLT